MNTKNLINLWKAYFIESWKTDLFQFGILAAIVLFNSITTGNGTSLSFAIGVSLIFLMIYPERLFRNLHSNSPKIHYLSVPASNNEKVLANMLLANIYYIAGLAAACGLGFALAHLYLTMRGYGGLHLYTNLDYADLIGFVYVSLAVFFFGGVYFRRKTTLSTVGVGLLVGTVFAMLASLTLWVNGLTLIPKGSTFNEFSWSFDSVEYLSEKGADILKYGMMSVMIVYFYALSFLRMKETEV